MMHFSIIHNELDFARLSGEWNNLLIKGASHVPFLRHEYLFNWWKYLGGGEWKSADLNIVIARNEPGEMIGIAPLFKSQNSSGENVLMLLGSIEISDFLDFIVPREYLQEFCLSMLEFLLEDSAFAWQSLDLYNLLDETPTTSALQDSAKRLGLSFIQQRLQHSPYIPLPTDWYAYLAKLDKKQRHEIRRKMRRLEEAAVGYRWYIVQDAESLSEEIEDLFNLMEFDPQKKAFLTPAMRVQFHALIKAAFENKWLQLSFLEIEGKKAAAYLNFDYDNQIWVYNSGINPEFNAYSPGWVLLSHLIQWAIEHQRSNFDFMRGNEDYKYRFGAIDRFVNRITISR
ncbi:MAG: GNAT family N-acetyltransferase [Anaerolineales bacterium]